MNVSIIIPTLEEECGIAEAVIRAWALRPAEVIVVDGGSRDRTAEFAAAAGAMVLQSAPGRGAQQNVGARAASGDVLLFLHADNGLLSGSLEQIAAALANPGVAWGAFRQRIESPRWSYRAIEMGNAWRVRWLGIAYGDQGIFVWRDVFEHCGGFPEIPLLEDLRLCRRLKREARPALLPGPLSVSPRRWQQQGILRQTLRNWSILMLAAWGVSPARLARMYRRAR